MGTLSGEVFYKKDNITENYWSSVGLRWVSEGLLNCCRVNKCFINLNLWFCSFFSSEGWSFNDAGGEAGQRGPHLGCGAGAPWLVMNSQRMPGAGRGAPRQLPGGCRAGAWPTACPWRSVRADKERGRGPGAAAPGRADWERLIRAQEEPRRPA